MRIETRDELAGLHWQRIAAGTEIVIAGEIDIRDHNGPVTIFCDGTVNDPVVIRGEGGLIRGGLRLTGQHFEVRDLHIENAGSFGLKLEGRMNIGPKTVEHVYISGCDIAGAVTGIWTEYAANVAISRNTIRDGIMFIGKGNDDDWGDMGVHIVHSSDVLVEGNLFRNLRGSSEDYENDGEAINISKTVSRIIVRGNRAYGVMTFLEQGGWAESAYPQADILIEGNVSYAMPEDRPLPGKHNSNQCVTIHTPLPWGKEDNNFRIGTLSNQVIRHNTFINHADQGGKIRMYVPGKDNIPPEVLRFEDNTYIAYETLTEAAFMARYPFSEDAPPVPPAVEPPVVEPVPPVVEPVPPGAGTATGTLELRIVATLNGQSIPMTDAVAALIVPDAISEEERALLDQLRGLPADKRALVSALVAAL